MSEDLHKRDMALINQLYLGNHLEDSELERADYIIKLLRLEHNRRIK